MSGLYPILLLVAVAAICFAAAFAWRSIGARQAALERFERGAQPDNLVDLGAVESRFPSRCRWVPWIVAVIAALLLGFVAGWSWTFAVAAGLMIGMLGTQLEAYLAARQIAKIESQLADAIDLMVGALGAGAGVATALHAACQETRQPLRRQLEDLLGRIRLGDEPRAAFETLARRVPLETFLLFASTLTVNWEVGGNLAPSLAAVGRTVRDRIEISRRIQSNIAQSHLSTLAVLSLTYFIALVVWRSDPEQMGAFLETELGKLAVAVTMVLQTLGMLWMSFISRMKF